MIELTLLTLLETMSVDFCEYKAEGNSTYKSLLLSYSNASEKHGIDTVRSVIESSEDLKKTAAEVVLKKCPDVL